MSDNKRATGPVQLPRFQFDGMEYFADLRLGEFRGVDDLSRRIVFDSPEGQMACDRAGIVGCRQCGTHFIVSGFVRRFGVRCVRCGVALN